jgi:predicted transcriptional regulator of viral defense system
MAQALPHTERVLRSARARGVLRPRDLDRLGIPRAALSRLERQGKLVRLGRGLYAVPEASGRSEHQALIEVAKRVPHAVVCLLSALRFHNLTTQSPFDVWIAIDRKAWRPRIEYPALRVFRFSGDALTEGIETHAIEGVKVRVYGPAKTVADCFKYRNKIGLDVAMEALRDTWRNRRATMDDLVRFSRICRVEHVMRPYLESLL